MKKTKIQGGDSRLAKLLKTVGLTDTSHKTITYEPIRRKGPIAGQRLKFDFTPAGIVANFTFDKTRVGQRALRKFRQYLKEYHEHNQK